MSEQNIEVPPYAIPQVGEAVIVFIGRRVPATYLGYERVADDFYMHQVQTDDGIESVASYNVYRLHGDWWQCLTAKPRVR